jgi:hypothetical protein
MFEMRSEYRKPEGRRPLEDVYIDWRVILIRILYCVLCEDVDCIYLAEDRDLWQAHVNTVVNFQILQM